MTTKMLEAVQDSSASGVYNLSSRTRSKGVGRAARGKSEGLHPRSMDITPSVLAKHASMVTATCPDPMNLMARQRLIPLTDYSRSIAKYAVPVGYVSSKTDRSLPAPDNIRQAHASPYWSDYWVGMCESVVGHLENKTFLPVRRVDLPQGAKLCPTVFAYRDKVIEDMVSCRARIAYRGDRQHSSTSTRTRSTPPLRRPAGFA